MYLVRDSDGGWEDGSVVKASKRTGVWSPRTHINTRWAWWLACNSSHKGGDGIPQASCQQDSKTSHVGEI